MNVINSKYSKVYYNIISNAKSKERTKSKDEYFESHHIIPRSLGGDNSKDNLVLLTAREHYICHWLLTKMTEGENKSKMICAFHYMSLKKSSLRKEVYFNSRAYQKNKIEFAKVFSEISKNKKFSKEGLERLRKSKIGKSPNLETREKIRQAHKGKIISSETREKIRQAHKGKEFSNSHKENIRKAKINISEETKEKLRKANLGKKLSDETKRKISESGKGRRQSQKSIQRLITYNKTRKLSTKSIEKLKLANLGKKLSDETKRKISESRKGRKFSESHKEKIKNAIAGGIWITNGIENKKIKKDSIIPDNWKRGLTRGIKK